MNIELLARPEIRNLRAYESARQVPDAVRLNANEAAWATGQGLNRYPEVRPALLHRRLATHYGVPQGNLLATRGSSEAIDLLIRAFCRGGMDSIVVTPPTFPMYRVYADIQGAQTIDAPLQAENEFGLDTDVVLQQCRPDTKLVFICSPNNPTGSSASQFGIRALAEARRDRSLIVVDEAYAEFDDAPSASALLSRYDNLVVLRTLSKALSLAGARCGAVLAAEPVIRMLNAILAPYALATPVVECVLHALSMESLQKSRDAVEATVRERERMYEALAGCPLVQKVWSSRGNFLLVKFRNLASVQSRLQRERILIRAFGSDAALENCARITVGKPEENDLLLAVLGNMAEQA
jgi:histidinol-phosphate aminotransferase